MSRTIARNAASLLTSQLLTWGISLVGLLIIPNHLGADAFGDIQFALAFVGFFTMVGSLGTPQFLLRAVARDHSLAGPYVVSGLAFKLCAAFVLACAALGLATMLGYSQRSMTLIAIGLLGMLFSLLNELTASSLAGMELMFRPALWSTVQAYVAGIGTVAVVLAHGDVVAYALALTLPGLIPLIGNLIQFRAYWPSNRRPDPQLIRRMVRGGVPLFALSGLIMVYGSIDMPILERMTDSETVARYSLAYRWVGIPVFISTVVVTAFAPAMSSLAVQTGDGFRRLTNRALRLVFIVAVPGSIGLILIAPQLIAILYGADFHDSARLMQVLSPHIPVAALDTVLGAALVASDRQRAFLGYAAFAAVVNPILTIIAVRATVGWWNEGGIGAGVATVLTEVFMMGGILRASKGTGVMDAATVRFGLRCGLACLPLAAVVLALSDTNLVLRVAAGALTYASFAIALRVLPVRRTLRIGRNLIRHGDEHRDDLGEVAEATRR